MKIDISVRKRIDRRMESPTFLITWLLILVSTTDSFGQLREGDADPMDRRRLNTLIISGSLAYGGTLVALNNLWYSDHPKESFHFFNDASEWNQMDKVGHLFSAFHLSGASAQSLRWAGMPNRKSSLIGAIVGFGMMLPIEIMDGYSSQYGASSTDILSNALGAGLYLGQSLLWEDIRIQPKFSFSNSGLSVYRPEVLGHNRYERLIKDYNGQTYWLSIDLDAFHSGIPSWINLAGGYGVHNMINAAGDATSEFPFTAYRQYYLALDWDLMHIQSDSKAVKTVLYIVSMIHLPAPAVEITSRGDLKLHFLHF